MTKQVRMLRILATGMLYPYDGSVETLAGTAGEGSGHSRLIRKGLAKIVSISKEDAMKFKGGKTPARLNANNQPIKPVSIEDKLATNSDIPEAKAEKIKIGSVVEVPSDEINKVADQKVEEAITIGDTQQVEGLDEAPKTKVKPKAKNKNDKNGGGNTGFVDITPDSLERQGSNPYGGITNN